jgi:hypothetical protein
MFWQDLSAAGSPRAREKRRLVLEELSPRLLLSDSGSTYPEPPPPPPPVDTSTTYTDPGLAPGGGTAPTYP